MVSALGGRCDEALVLDGACSEQRRPVGAARHFREGRGQHDEVGLGKAAEEFGKAQVEAEREADGEGLAVPGRHPEGDGGLAGFDVDALVVELGLVLQAEEMDAVVAGRDVAFRIEHERGLRVVGGVLSLERNRASDDPEAAAHGRHAHGILDRAFADGFGNAEVGGVARHQGEVLGEHDEIGARVGGGRNEVDGVENVLFGINARNHLAGGNAHGVKRKGCCVRTL